MGAITRVSSYLQEMFKYGRNNPTVNLVYSSTGVAEVKGIIASLKCKITVCLWSLAQCVLTL